MSASATSKLTLLMELKNKLFNEKLMETKRKFTKVKDKMMGGVKKLKMRFVNAFQAMRDEIPLFGRAMDLLGNPYALIIAGVVALTAALGKGFVEAKKFNHEFLQVKQLNLDKSSSQLSQYKEQIRDAAFEVGTGLQDSTKAFYDLQSATGVYGKGAVEIFKKVGRFSISTGASLEDSMNATTKAMKAFNLQLGDIDNLLESNAKTVQTGITTFDELAKVQTQFGGAAGNIGQSVETANKLFASFTAIGGSASEAATLTKTFFQGLAQRGKQIEKYLNIKVFDEKGNFKQADQILKDIADRFSNLSQQQVADLIAKIGGPDGLNQMLFKMKGNAGDVINTFDSFDGSKFNLSAALKNAKGDVTILGKIVKNKFNIIMSKLGTKILPIVARGLEWSERVLDKVYRNFDKVTHYVKTAIVAFTTFKATNMLLSSSFRISLTSGINSATGAMRRFNAAFKSNMIGLITSLIATLAFQILNLKNESEQFQKFLEKTKNFNKKRDDLINGSNKDALKANVKDITAQQANAIKNAALARIKEMEDLNLSLKASFASDNMNAKNAIKANNELKQLRKEGINTPYKEQQELKLKFTIDENVKEITKGLTLDDINKTIETNKKTLKRLKERKLISNQDPSDNNVTGTLNDTAGSQISNVQGQASGPRTINIHIDAINKGGINTSNTTLAGMNAEEIEEWFTETIMRTIRGIELSHG